MKIIEFPHPSKDRQQLTAPVRQAQCVDTRHLTDSKESDSVLKRWERKQWGQPHNGWSNYQTWQVYFSIAAEDAIYGFWLGRAAEYCRPEVRPERSRKGFEPGNAPHRPTLCDEMCDAFYDIPLVSVFGVHSELLMTALGRVDWQRLAAALHDESVNNSHDADSPLSRNSLTDGRIRFSAGRVTASPAVLKIISKKELVDAVIRHQRGDWGLVDAALRQANEMVIHDEGRLVSAYTNMAQIEFWIITDYDRAATNVFLPSEY